MARDALSLDLITILISFPVSFVLAIPIMGIAAVLIERKLNLDVLGYAVYLAFGAAIGTTTGIVIKVAFTILFNALIPS